MPSGRRVRGGRAAFWQQRCPALGGGSRAPWQQPGRPRRAARCPAGEGAEAGAVPGGRAGPGHVRPLHRPTAGSG